ncbi:murein biosynthesis integral membrane protein MurJ [Thermodesulfobacteriota bacterium]
MDKSSGIKENSEKKDLGRAAGVVGFYTFLSRILGLVRDMVIAVFFGATISADAFFVAFKIPNMLRRFTAEGSMTIAFIPVFTEYLKNRSKKEAFELARIILTLLSIILVVITIFGIILSPWIVRLIAYGFGGEGTKYELTVLLTRITFPYVILVSLVAFFMGILNSLKHFAAPAAAPVFLNLGIIGSTFLISPYFSEPVMGTAIGVLIGGMLQVMLQLPWIYKNGVSLKPLWNPGHPAVAKIGMLVLPALFGSAIYQINQFAGTLLASFLPVGSISWLYYADRLVELPLGVFAIAISTAALPSLSRQAVEKDRNAFMDTLEHALKLTFFISIPSMMGLIILGKPIIQLFFQRGAFNALSSDMTANALFFYALGLWAFSGVKIVVSAFYALQDTVTPVKVSVITFFSYIIFGVTLMGPLKHGGLALALSLSSALNFMLLVFLLKRKLPYWLLTPIIISVLKILMSAAVMGLSVFCLKLNFFPNGYDPGVFSLGVKVFFLVISGIIIYLVSASVFRCGELRAIVDLVKSRK